MSCTQDPGVVFRTPVNGVMRQTGRLRMERHFEKDLNELKERLLWMGSLAERAVHQSVHAVLDSDEQTPSVYSMKKTRSTNSSWKLTTASCNCSRFTN